MRNSHGPFGLPRDDGGGADGPRPQPPSGAGASGDLTLSITGVRAAEGDEAGWIDIDLETTRGQIRLLMAPSEGSTGVAVFLAGAGGGHQGPPGSPFPLLGEHLAAGGISAVRVVYREPGEFEECVADALAACSFLKGVGAVEAVLVGHSFGGAVAIRAGGLSSLVTGVAALATQRFGTFEVDSLGKPLLLVHGDQDEVLDRAASDDVFQRAREPKELVILEGTGHGFQERGDELFGLISAFVAAHAPARSA